MARISSTWFRALRVAAAVTLIIGGTALSASAQDGIEIVDGTDTTEIASPSSEHPSISFITESGSRQEACVTPIEEAVANSNVLENGYYFADGYPELPDGFEVTGDVSLIVGGTLSIGEKGIHVAPGAKLHIYAMEGRESKATVLACATGPDDCTPHALVSNEGSFELTSVRLTRAADHTTTIWRGIDCAEGSTTTVYSGEISDFVTGVFNYEGVLRLYGGNITGNTFGIQHEGWDTLSERNDGCELHVKGAPVVTENNREGNPDAGDICMTQLDQIILDGPLTNGARLGVFRGYDDCPLTQGYAEHNSGCDPSQFFMANRDDHFPELGEDGEVKLGHYVNYIDENGEVKHREYKQMRQTKLGYRAKGVDGYSKDEQTFTTGWYLVGGVTYKDRVEIKGDVKMVVLSGRLAEFRKGIHVAPGNSLTIYSTTGEKGTIQATSINGEQSSISDPSYHAAIGGNNNENAGKIVICCTNVYAASECGAAIGAGSKRSTSDYDIEILGNSTVQACTCEFNQKHKDAPYPKWSAIGANLPQDHASKNVGKLTLDDGLTVYRLSDHGRAWERSREDYRTGSFLSAIYESLDFDGTWYDWEPDYVVTDVAPESERLEWCRNTPYIRIEPA